MQKEASSRNPQKLLSTHKTLYPFALCSVVIGALAHWWSTPAQLAPVMQNVRSGILSDFI